MTRREAFPHASRSFGGSRFDLKGEHRVSQPIEDLIRRFVAEVMNRGNFDMLDEIVDPSHVYRSPDEELHGTEALKDFLAGYHAAFPDLLMAVDELVVADDMAVIFFTLSGTHEGRLMGIPPTGNTMRAHGVVRSRFEDGRIVEEWEIIDSAGDTHPIGRCFASRVT